MREKVDYTLSPIFGKPVNGSTTSDSIVLYIEPSAMSEPESLQFEYSITSTTNVGIGLELEFANPSYVSATVEPE